MGPTLKDTKGQMAPGGPEKHVLSESGELMELDYPELQGVQKTIQLQNPHDKSLTQRGGK